MIDYQRDMIALQRAIVINLFFCCYFLSSTEALKGELPSVQARELYNLVAARLFSKCGQCPINDAVTLLNCAVELWRAEETPNCALLSQAYRCFEVMEKEFDEALRTQRKTSAKEVAYISRQIIAYEPIPVKFFVEFLDYFGRFLIHFGRVVYGV